MASTEWVRTSISSWDRASKSYRQTAARPPDERTSQLTVEENPLDGTNDDCPDNNDRENVYPRILQVETAALAHSSITEFNKKYTRYTEWLGA